MLIAYIHWFEKIIYFLPGVVFSAFEACVLSGRFLQNKPV
jgi:hypothetical protein